LRRSICSRDRGRTPRQCGPGAQASPLASSRPLSCEGNMYIGVGKHMLGGWVNPHREQHPIPQGQTSSPPKSFFTPTASPLASSRPLSCEGNIYIGVGKHTILLSAPAAFYFRLVLETYYLYSKRAAPYVNAPSLFYFSFIYTSLPGVYIRT